MISQNLFLRRVFKRFTTLFSQKCMDSIYVSFSKKQSYRDRNQIGGCQSLGREERTWGPLRGGDGNILYLDWGGGYMIVYVCQNSKPHT